MIEKLQVLTTPEVIRYLDQLLRSGLYGFTREDVAERLIARSILELIRENSTLVKRESK